MGGGGDDGRGGDEGKRWRMGEVEMRGRWK